MTLISELAAPPLGSLIMIMTTPLFAFLVATVVEFAAILMLFVIPETLQQPSTDYEILSEDTIEPDDELLELQEPRITYLGANSLTKVWRKVTEMPIFLKEAMRLASQDRYILLSLPSFLVAIMGKELVAILLQYTSTRYGWTLAAVRGVHNAHQRKS